MRIRIEGGRAELDAAVRALRQVLDVHGTSRAHPNRTNDRLRIYVDAHARRPETTEPTTSHRQDGPPTHDR
ncbi:hypothetical protein [Parafrankia sp. FMc2]|uniref:hypothetical protein n=1 Tax=Parafrankia sp. FMc2 TaxID=3233196 RepID=UPI0034D3A1AA